MDRNRIGTESVDDQCVVVAVGTLVKRQSAVAQDNLGVGAAVLEISKIARVTCYSLHGFIDFIKGPFLAGLPIARQAARP